MDFNKFREFMLQEYAKAESAIKKESSGINLTEILENIDFKINLARYKTFSEGDSFRLELKDQYIFSYEVYLCENSLVLHGINSVELVKFESQEVQNYYKGLVKQIQKAQENGEGPYATLPQA